jgi:GAF domain-containing protein
MTIIGGAPETAITLAQLAAAIDADRSAELYLDRGDGVLELVAAVPAGHAPAGGTGASGSPTRDAHASRLAAWLRRASGAFRGTTAHLILPDERRGLLVLARRRSEPFSEDDLALARVQARRLAGTVVTRLGPRPIAWSAQLEAVQSVAAQLTRLTSVEEVSAALCTHAQRVVAFDNARVYVLHEDGRTLEPVAFRPHAREYLGESVVGLRVAVGEGITGWVAAHGQPLNIPDAAADPRTVDIPGSMDLAEESMLLAPLRSEGRVIGVVVLSRLGLDRFSGDELRLLGVLADQAAVAIENAHLLAERDRHVTELAALLDISQAGGGLTNERELADVLAAKLRHAAGMDSSLVSRWDDESGRLVNIGASGRPLDGQERDLAVDRATRHTLMNDEPLWLDPSFDDLDPTELQRLTSLGGAAALLMPMSTAGRVVGLVELVSEQSGRHFHAGEVARAGGTDGIAAQRADDRPR